jgi:hypothetical protein
MWLYALSGYRNGSVLNSDFVSIIRSPDNSGDLDSDGKFAVTPPTVTVKLSRAFTIAPYVAVQDELKVIDATARDKKCKTRRIEAALIAIR